MSNRGDDDGPGGLGPGTRTARSKFLEVVKGAAEAHHLELVVDPDGPSSGYGYIQKRDHFSNLYAFHFEFSDASAVFYLGTESTKELSSEQRRQVELSDGKGMELILEEIRNKVEEAAEGAFPFLSSLATRSPPAVPASSAEPAKAPPSSKGDAVLWGQDETSIGRDRYRYKEMPQRSRTTAIVSIVLLLVLVFTLAPLLDTQSGMASCHAASCKTSTSFYESPSFHLFGVGGVYVPQGVGWGTFGEGTVQSTNGTLMSGIGVSQFYIVW